MSASSTGWQKDGSYVSCQECKWAPPVERRPRPGQPVNHTGTVHYGDCPTIPRLSPEAQRRLHAALEESARCRRRAMAAAHNYVIG